MKREVLDEVVAVVRDVAREAADLCLAGYRKPCDVEYKGAVDLVTRFDRESEALSRERLTARFPFAFVGEEEGGTWPSSEPAFVVDPLDGTTNFVHGHPFWCVSIGLVEGPLPVLGVVVAPALGLEWYGYVSDDGGCTAERLDRVRGGPLAPCAVSPTARFEASLLATGFPYDRRTSPDNNFDAFVAIKQRCQAVRRCGSAALDLCLVADGTYEGYWERKLRPWDVAAGAALVRAAGGRVTDFHGREGYMATGHVVATNARIHDALLEELVRSESLT